MSPPRLQPFRPGIVGRSWCVTTIAGIRDAIVRHGGLTFTTRKNAGIADRTSSRIYVRFASSIIAMCTNTS